MFKGSGRFTEFSGFEVTVYTSEAGGGRGEGILFALIVTRCCKHFLVHAYSKHSDWTKMYTIKYNAKHTDQFFKENPALV